MGIGQVAIGLENPGPLENLESPHLLHTPLPEGPSLRRSLCCCGVLIPAERRVVVGGAVTLVSAHQQSPSAHCVLSHSL